MVLLGLTIILFVPTSSAYAESDIVGSCSITIDANKHKSGHSYANASGACKGEIFGDYGTELVHLKENLVEALEVPTIHLEVVQNQVQVKVQVE